MRRRQLSAELTHPTAKDVGEDGLLAAIVHLREGQVIEMTCQAWSNSIPSPSRRSHGTDKINIHQLLKRTLRSVKAGPNAELKPKHPNLPRKFMYLSTGQLLPGALGKDLGRTDLLPVVPALVVHPLPQQLNGWLCTKRLQHGHVQVINKKDKVPPDWRPKHTFPPVGTELSKDTGLAEALLTQFKSSFSSSGFLGQQFQLLYTYVP